MIIQLYLRRPVSSRRSMYIIGEVPRSFIALQLYTPYPDVDVVPYILREPLCTTWPLTP